MRHPFLSAAALIALSTGATGTSQAARKEDPQPWLEHIAVWSQDCDKTAAFLQEALGWRRHPLQFGVRDDSKEFGGMKLAFIDANGFWLELVEPTTPGPGMEYLKLKGNGSLIELDFQTRDFDATVAAMKARGIEMAGMDGNPVQDGGNSTLIALEDGKPRYDERVSYLPLDVTRGTSIELYWEHPSGVVLQRDRSWKEQDKTPHSAPRLDHALVIAADLGKSADVYTDILTLPRHSSTAGLPREWMGFGTGQHAWIRGNDHGMWIALMAPSTAADGKALMSDTKFGDGAIMELAAEVPDIAAFYDAMKTKGITMTAGDDTPLAAGQKSVVVSSTGDHYSYFPLDKSEGMRILVFQRGPKATSVFHQRDEKSTR
jgi:catechol 2,3-dioxygenase-like lactoylglutathione lyase family enzyme